MIQTMIAGIIRAILAAWGGSLVQRGYIDSDALQQGIGAFMTLCVIAWSAWQKYRSKMKAIEQVERELIKERLLP